MIFYRKLFLLEKNLEGAGRNPSTLNIEDDLLKWIGEQSRLEIAISTNEIIEKLLEMDPNKKENSFHSLQMLCYRLLKRNSYGISSITHIGQKIKESYKQEYADFFTNLYRRRFHIGDIDSYPNIFNMDETSICFEIIAHTTVEKIGEKSVNVRNFGIGRNRITVILCIGAN